MTEAASGVETPPLDRATRIFYGLGAAAFGVKDNGFSYLLLLFYNQVVGLPAQAVGGAIALTLIFDACIDPFIGQLSDTVRTRWGRRHPFLYLAPLPIALLYVAVWNPPHWSPAALWWYLLFTAIGVRAMVSVYEVPSYALAAELTTDYDERAVILSYRTFFAWIGGLSIQSAAFAFFFKPDALHKVGQLNPVGYARYGLTGAIVIFLAMLISALGTHRRIPHLVPPPPVERAGLFQIIGQVLESWSNPSFIFMIVSTLVSALIVGMGAALNQYWNTFYWGFGPSDILGLTLGVFLSAVLALVLGPPLAKRVGKRNATMLTYAGAVLAGVVPISARYFGLMPANHTPALFLIILSTSITAVTMAIIAGSMGGAMVADIVEVSQVKTARRSEGLFFSAYTFIAKATSAFGVIGASTLIAVIGLKPGQDPAKVPPAVTAHLAELYIPLAIVLYTLAILLLFGYRISRASHKAAVDALKV